jgi:uncharacterized protein YjbI with pentapeptide repeats
MRTYTDRDIRILVARSSVGAHHLPLDLSNANLEMANLPAIDLRGANLAGANLRGAMLWSARLDFACLDSADLTCANLTWCLLVGCSMRGTLLLEADLDEATVDDGIDDAITAGADMVTVTFQLRARVRAQKDVQRRMGALPETVARAQALLDLHQQNAPPSLRRRGAAGFEQKVEQLRQADVRVLSDGDLQDLLRWSAATQKPLNLRGCNIAGANLRNASLDGSCLAFANLTGADTRGASFVGADMEDARGWSG